ncbi:hypothetical protein [Thalassobellus sediminis]|uniref:hypothetical protein n=1 Tax=Thalassobellus sediminis TaxID=3367753 RepID=UPI0037BBE0FE
MKTINQLFSTMAAALLLFTTSIISAQEQQEGPQYITVTTMHWNMDYEDFDMDTWKSVEKEYLDKVTKNNEHIMASSFYLHQMTADNTEIIYVNVYGSWGAIEKASVRSGELEKEAWPDETERKAFLKKQQAYYSHEHSDEIYTTLPLVKPIPQDNTKDMICYVRKTHFAYPEDVENSEIKDFMTENFNKLIKDNPLIKGYYPHRHAWGSDGTEIMEGYFLDSMADLEAMFDGLPDLMKEAWPDEAVRKARGEKMNTYFTGVHGDAVYKFLAELSK